MSWLHIDDFLAAIRHIESNGSLTGPVHLTSPNPVQNRQMMASLRSALRRPWAPPTPRPLVYVGALFMRTDPALALTGRRCVPNRLLESGFEFEHPTFEGALVDLVAT